MPEKKKPQVLAHPGLRGNVEIYKETNVMHDNSTATAQVIPFRQKELLLVGNAGEPFVPMKPVVEGMGLAWQSQHRKLQSGRFATCITEMVIQLPGDTQRRPVSCLPLRKLTGWLMSIHPNKVRPELREGIIAYQNECDDVLWAYWNEGAAVRRDDRTAASVLATTIGTDGFHCLAAIVDGKVRRLPSAIRRGAKNHIWSQVHKAFSVVTAEDIPADQLDSARNFIAAYALEGEWLPKEEKKPGAFVLDEYQAQFVHSLIHYTHWVCCRWDQGIGAAVKALNPKFHAKTWEFFRDLRVCAEVLESAAPELVAHFRSRGALRPHDCIAAGHSVGHPAD
ncbi:TPA: phage antirepressor N-terminal domain-containing protein [Pseudomonas aeruginosa]|uniref:phage antirepressor N-terminal domain-containing protein n=1 Tax=Pseudomonas aeruginosa TaxID=287 RepID=UPI001C8E5DFA|nr:phage antirepressor N-terminal domain-containing protein [Pseudomonas aeruginosa]HCG0890475.1 phage antirepressor N-terminal domain-containing protein [Pseudomonas aeruginosa]HEH6406393.1 phage antirepressor N-terminal domain-containing protein [Pseudomonas aeruginosa]